jgi:hypothetical protein
MDDQYRERVESKLKPEVMGLALIRSGALLTGYELVKTSILEDIKSFYSVGISGEGVAHDTRYERDVLTLAPNKFEASVEWLVRNQALDRAHVDILNSVRSHRHEVAHELARFLVDPDADVNVELLSALHRVMRALDRFWGSIEIDVNPDLDGREVNPEDIHSGSRLLFDYLLQISGVDIPN